jgi:hypothetical protein
MGRKKQADSELPGDDILENAVPLDSDEASELADLDIDSEEKGVGTLSIPIVEMNGESEEAERVYDVLRWEQLTYKQAIECLMALCDIPAMGNFKPRIPRLSEPISKEGLIDYIQMDPAYLQCPEAVRVFNIILNEIESAQTRRANLMLELNYVNWES